MNSDTAKSLAAILTNGYYPPGLTLGEGGWPEFHQRIQGEPQWNKYILIAENESPSEVIARNVKCARAYFESIYPLPDHYKIRVFTSLIAVYSQ